MEKSDILTYQLWKDKVIVLFHLINDEKINKVLDAGFAKTEKYPYILYKNYFDKMLSYIKPGTSIALIAIPDEVYKHVYGISDPFYSEWKSQFDYVDDSGASLDEIGSFCVWNQLTNKIENYIPSSLIYGIISFDNEGKQVFCKNERFYDNLKESQKSETCELLRIGFYEHEISYGKYLHLSKKI